MNAKKIDKIAIGTLYVIAGIIVTILAALILYILVRGIPHISWSFWWRNWGSTLQFILPFGYYPDYFCASFYGSWDLLIRIC